MNHPRVKMVLHLREARKHEATNWLAMTGGVREGRAPSDNPGRDVDPGKAFWEILPDGAWVGHRAFIIGGGPSLAAFDFSRLRGELVIGVNASFAKVDCQVMFSMDSDFHDWLLSGALEAKMPGIRQKFLDFAGLKVWLDAHGHPFSPGVRTLRSLGASGLTSSLKDGVFHGENSGYAALNIAVCLGANPIYLLGFDGKLAADGRAHHHEEYPTPTTQGVLDKFVKYFHKIAPALQDRGVRVVNLNAESAIRCFEFGDADKVLPAPKPSTGGITAITPTGDRPLAFRLCQQWMANQTRKPDQWVIVDDGKVPMVPDLDWYNATMPGVALGIRREPRPDDPQHTLVANLKAAFPLITGNKILIMEDDEYYAPEYIAEMARRLDSHEVVGIMKAKYYHLPTGGCFQIGNRSHASLAETGFRRSFLPELEKLWDGDTSLDMRIWKKADGRGRLFDDRDKPLYVGIKGLPGRAGIGAGHNPELSIYHNSKDTPDRATLKAWAPKDYPVYLDIISGKLNGENYRSYFPAAPLPITGITVCWNTKDLIERAYNSIRKFYPSMPIIIIDGSDPGDPCAAYVRGLASDVTTVVSLGYNIGHGRGMCMGIDKAKAPYALMFDSDIELLEPCVPAMLAMMEADTFGVGYIEDIGYDGFRYKIHPHPEGSLPCLHPYFQLIDIKNYKKFHPYVHHGMPVYLTMLDIHKKGLSGKILKQFPGLVNNGPKFVEHHSSGTGGMRIARGLTHIEGPWVKNRGQV